MQHARFKPRGGAHAIPSRDLTLGVVQQKEPQKTISPEIQKVQSGKTELRGTMGNPSSPT